MTSTIDGVPLFLAEHLDRLWSSAKGLGLEIGQTRQEISDILSQVVTLASHDNLYLRLIITRGEGEIGLDPQLAAKNNIIVIARQLRPNPQWWYQKGVEVIIADRQRISKKAVDPNVKSGNYLNNVLAMQEARKQHAFDAIMLNAKGNVTEATTSNIWRVKDDTFITPPLEAGLLGGITRAKLIELLKQKRLKFREENFNSEDLLKSDEVFLTASTKNIVPIVKINQKTIGAGVPGAKTLQLRQLYLELIEQHVKSFQTAK